MGSTDVRFQIGQGRSSLSLNRENLVGESSVFRTLFEDQGLTRLELKDFDPDIASLFLSLFDVDNGTRDNLQIDYQTFHDLHKLAMVFDVQWLVKRCRDWLKGEIQLITFYTDYDEKLFLFEECRFILNRWKHMELMDVLLLKMIGINDHLFIARYMNLDLEKKVSSQIDLMMIMSGSNTQVFMEIIIRSISGKAFICKNIKYLLQKINLPLCFEQNDELCHQMFEMLSDLSELTKDDHAFLFRTLRESIKEVSSRKTLIKTKRCVYSRSEWNHFLESCKIGDDIVELVSNGRVESMFVVVFLLIHVARFNSPSIAAEAFVTSLIECAANLKSWKKVSYEFLDLILAVLEKSDHPEKMELISTLQVIKGKAELSSRIENIHLCSSSKTSMELNSKFAFEFKHPGLPNAQDCNRSTGKCGFLIQDKGMSHEKWLCRKEESYDGTDIHYHDIVCAEDMFYYKIWTCKLADGSKLKVPFRWRWRHGQKSFWDWLFPSINEFKDEQYCIAYNIRKHLVLKEQ